MGGISQPASAHLGPQGHRLQLTVRGANELKPAEAQCRLVFPIPRTGTNCGADPLVRSRPPGRLADGCRRLSPHAKSGTRASWPRGHPDQGVRPTAYAEPSFAKTKWHWAEARSRLVPHP